jgi:hypothetical protein
MSKWPISACIGIQDSGLFEFAIVSMVPCQPLDGAHSTSSLIASAILSALHATSLQLAAQVAQKMLCVHVAGDEFGTLTHDFRQNGFAISVNRRHLDQINDASPRVVCVVRLSPSRLELIGPLPDQLTLQRPPLSIG